MRKGENNLGIAAQVPTLDLSYAQSGYVLVLNGKHVRNVSTAEFYFPNWRFGTLQNRR